MDTEIERDSEDEQLIGIPIDADLFSRFIENQTAEISIRKRKVK